MKYSIGQIRTIVGIAVSVKLKLWLCLMKYRNNLSDNIGCTYLKVIKPFMVYALVGYQPSNSFIGSSQMLGNIYKRITLEIGSEIYDLPGGVFVVHTGKSYAIKMQLSGKHPFEKTYGMEVDIFPLENMQVISKPAIKLKLDPVPIINVPIKFFERGIDSIID